jgi:hypothetical protein
MSKIEVNTVDVQCGSTLTLGSSGKTVTLATGASQSGFGRAGSVDWQTGSIKTSTFTAADGEGYFIDTSGGAVTMNLPAGSAGAIVALADYKRTFNSNNLTISPNGSNKIGGTNDTVIADIEGQAATFVYVDDTQGWINVQNAEDTEAAGTFITATGGTITTVCTNFKVHTFTSPGTFCVSAGSGPKSKIDYLVIGGGGSGANNRGGGGGSGGYRESHTSSVSGCYTAAPTASPSPLGPLTGPTAIPVTVGAGAVGTPNSPPNQPGSTGSVSTFSTITSAGGGFGGYNPSPVPGAGGPGGSGGGGAYPNLAGGSGNTPPVSPPQGNDGGTSNSTNSGSGGGGSGATGGASSNCTAGSGGDGLTTNITGSPVQRGGGGGGSGNSGGGSAGAGGGGTGYVGPSGTHPNDDGTANTGGGGGAARNGLSGAGGSGVVIIRYKFQ